MAGSLKVQERSSAVSTRVSQETRKSKPRFYIMTWIPDAGAPQEFLIYLCQQPGLHGAGLQGTVSQGAGLQGAGCSHGTGSLQGAGSHGS